METKPDPIKPSSKGVLKIFGPFIGLFWAYTLDGSAIDAIMATSLGFFIGYLLDLQKSFSNTIRELGKEVYRLKDELNILRDELLKPGERQKTRLPEKQAEKQAEKPPEKVPEKTSGKIPETAKAAQKVEPQKTPAVKDEYSQAAKTAAAPSASYPGDQFDAGRLAGRLKEYLGGKNTAVLAGIVILFLGLVFLVKYTIEHFEMPIELRLSAAMLAGAVLVYLGWRLREKKTQYALILQGGGVSILYMTIFVSFRIYELIPAGAAFAALVLVMIFSMTLSVLQNSLVFALISTTGGFMAPILASTGSGNYVALFSYYAILNAGILGVAFWRSWKPLNLTGFLFTFGIASLWGFYSYKPEDLVNCEIFLNLFFIMFAVISVLFSIKQPPKLVGLVDGTLAFALPMIYTSIQFYLLRDIEYGRAIASFGLGLFYLICVSLLFRKSIKGLHTLMEAFLILGIIFGNLAVPLAMDAPATSAFWAIEGAGLLWLGIRQSRIVIRGFGFLLQFGAWLYGFHRISFLTPEIFFNSQFTGVLILTIAGAITGYLYKDRKDIKAVLAREEYILSLVFLGGAFLWWMFAWFLQIKYLVSDAYFGKTYLLFFGFSGIALAGASRGLKWNEIKYPFYFFLPAVFVFLMSALPHPLGEHGALYWPAFYALCAVFLWLIYPDKEIVTLSAHFIFILIVLIMITAETHYHLVDVMGGTSLWSKIVFAAPALGALYLSRSKKFINIKFINIYKDVYFQFMGTLLAVFVLFYTLFLNLATDADPAPLSYIPVLNPLDIFSLLVMAVCYKWAIEVKNEYPKNDAFEGLHAGMLPLAVSILTAGWVNLTVARVLHHMAGIEWSLDAMIDSNAVQTVYTVTWGLSGLIFMILGARKILRPVWFLGTVFMGITVLKLFMVDLSNIGTLYRIITFIVVGILLLIVGYLAPVPPDQDKLKQEKNKTP